MTKVVRRGLHTYGYLLIISTIITVFAALTTIGVSAEVTFDTSYYKYNGKEGVTITGFNGLNGDETVTIPAEVGNKPVLAIGLYGVVTTTRVPGAEKIGALDLTQADNLKVIFPYAFYNCENLKGTIESNKIEKVGTSAFYGSTGLASLNLSALDRVESSAFENCTGLTSLNLSALETVESSAFENCTGLTSLNLSALEMVGYSAFYNCTELTIFSAPKVTRVGFCAFNNCSSLKNIILKNNCSINFYRSCVAVPDDCTITYVNDKGDVVKTINIR